MHIIPALSMIASKSFSKQQDEYYKFSCGCLKEFNRDCSLVIAITITVRIYETPVDCFLVIDITLRIYGTQ